MTTKITAAVAKWAHERGSNPRYRIVLAGYEGEHDWLESEGWTMYVWSANGGYGRLGKGKTRGKDNRHRERLWFSPHCIHKDSPKELKLFSKLDK